MPTCRIGIEAFGHTVKVTARQYVKPFLKHHKNDRDDAEAICTALMQPDMKFAPPKNEEQQDSQALHRARRQLVNHRTVLACQMRGLLLDRGVATPLTLQRPAFNLRHQVSLFAFDQREWQRKSDSGFRPGALGRARQHIPEILEDQSNGLTEMTREIIADLFEFMLQLDAQIKAFNKHICQVFRSNPGCQRIAQICGVGSKMATAVIAAVGDG